MRKNSGLILWAFLLAACVLPSFAFADEAPDADLPANMPQRERALIDILLSGRKQYTSSHAQDAAADARMAMQIRIMTFMRESQLATDWVGTVKSRGLTPDGRAWISIEIADNILITTWQSERDDFSFSTLLRPHTATFTAAQAAKIGSPIVFSATVLNSLLSNDEEMLLRPQFIARFTALRPAQ
jgi:hypothetical protein